MKNVQFSNSYHTINKRRISLIGFVVAVVLVVSGVWLPAKETVKTYEEKPSLILLSIGENWEPYYSKSLPNGGVAVEIVRTAFERVGYAFEIDWLPWARALNMAKTGSYDGLLGAWHTEERTQFFVYTQPFLKTELVFFKRKGEPIAYTNLQDLKSYSIGVARDSGPFELLRPKFEQNLDIATSAEMNIKKLMWKRFDLLADEKLNVLHIINTQFPEWRDAIEILDPPLQINYLHVIISKQRPDAQVIVDAFNRGLKEIRENGTFETILNDYNFSE